jgi:hypothetical protein
MLRAPEIMPSASSPERARDRLAAKEGEKRALRDEDEQHQGHGPERRQRR